MNMNSDVDARLRRLALQESIDRQAGLESQGELLALRIENKLLKKQIETLKNQLRAAGIMPNEARE
jgi:hypothetical protein